MWRVDCFVCSSADCPRTVDMMIVGRRGQWCSESVVGMGLRQRKVFWYVSEETCPLSWLVPCPAVTQPPRSARHVVDHRERMCVQRVPWTQNGADVRSVRSDMWRGDFVMKHSSFFFLTL